MRTKTLLIAAAALVAGIISSEAQTVYSANVVGYYNIVIPTNSFALVANQLINGSDANQTNNDVNTIFSGMISDPNGNNNTTLYLWDGNGYGVYQYYTAADATTAFFESESQNGFYDSIGNLVNASLNQGGGSFLYNPSTTTAVTNTMVGTVPQGTNILTISAGVTGFNLYSFVPPVAGGLTSTNSFAQFPGTSDPNGNTNDVLYQWDGNGYGVYQYYTAADATTAFFETETNNGFYDSIGNPVVANIPVGQAFFILHYGGPVAWTNSLVVQ